MVFYRKKESKSKNTIRTMNMFPRYPEMFPLISLFYNNTWKDLCSMANEICSEFWM